MDAVGAFRGLGAVVVEGRVQHFGAPETEAASTLAGTGAALVPLAGVTLLRLTGADRAAFLHGQLSNRVEGVGVGGSNRTLQLNARGQVVGEAVLCVRETELVLAVDDGRGAAVRGSLERHIVFDDVVLGDPAGGFGAVTVQGEAAAEVVERALGGRPQTGTYLEGAVGGVEVLAVARRRTSAGGYDLYAPLEGLARLAEALGAAGSRLAGELALTAARVAAGIPSAALDGGDGSLPQELGLEDAVSRAKGCYLGQEIMARIDARGAVRRRLARLRLEGDESSLVALRAGGDRSLRSADREAGRLGTVARFPDGSWHGLGLVRRELADDAVLEVAGVRVVPAPAEAL